MNTKLNQASLTFVAMVFGLAIFSKVDGNPQSQKETIVVRNPGRSSRLPTAQLKVVAPGPARTLTATEVKTIVSNLRVKPTATKWNSVTLDARHTYYPNASLDFCGAAIHNATDNYVFMVGKDGLSAEAQVQFDAPSAGDTYLVTYYVQATIMNTSVKIFSSSDAPVASFKLNPGYHQIPVAVVIAYPGDQFVSLLLESAPIQSMYFQKAVVQLLSP